MAKSVGKLLAESMLQSRSELYRWLHANYAQIAPIIDAQRRPSWEALAKTAGESGLPRPTRQGVRKAWMRLKQDMDEAGGKPSTTREHTKARGEAIAIAERQPAPIVSSPAVSTLPGIDEQGPPDEPPSRHAFRPAKIR
jgi:hypothetical protein